MSLVEINDSDFSELVLGSVCPVLVDFYADWCVPCRNLAPTLERLSGVYGKFKFFKVNIDRNPNLSIEFGVRSIPTVIIFNASKPVSMLSGSISRSMLVDAIEGV